MSISKSAGCQFLQIVHSMSEFELSNSNLAVSRKMFILHLPPTTAKSNVYLLLLLLYVANTLRQLLGTGQLHELLTC